MEVVKVEELLREKGARVTRARRAVIDTVFTTSTPIDARALLLKLQKQNIIVNKTTVYRELDFLSKSGILKLVFLKPGTVHYESAFLPHHHHLVCNTCGGVEEVDCVINEEKLLGKIKKSGFKLENHKFEIYGICVDCR